MIMNNQNEVERLDMSQYSNNPDGNYNVSMSYNNQNFNSEYIGIDVNEKSIGSMSFRYITCYFILEILVEFLFILFGVKSFFSNLPNYFGLSIHSNESLLLIGCGILFFYSFFSSFLVSFLAFRDTFLKKRVISKKNKSKFFLIVTILFPIVLNLCWYFLGMQQLLISVIFMVAQILATCINFKKVKTI